VRAVVALGCQKDLRLEIAAGPGHQKSLLKVEDLQKAPLLETAAELGY